MSPSRSVVLKLNGTEEAVSVHGMHIPDLNWGISAMVYFRDHDSDSGYMRGSGIFGRELPAPRAMSPVYHKLVHRHGP